MREETSLGGNLNDAVRVGDTVRRTTGHWTPAIHALLRYLESRDFPAPRVRGIDDEGREILEYIPGVAHSGTNEPLPDHVLDEVNLIDAAKLLRRYHDVVADFRPPKDAHWRIVAPTKHEIICHNDWSPWNALFRDGRVALTLDWDLAGPGSRLWGVANGAASWVPLSSEHTRHTIAQKAARLRLFLDAYGLSERSEFISTVQLQFQHVGQVVADAARLGDPGMQRLVRMDVPSKLRVDVDDLERHRAVLERAL